MRKISFILLTFLNNISSIAVLVLIGYFTDSWLYLSLGILFNLIILYISITILEYISNTKKVVDKHQQLLSQMVTQMKDFEKLFF